MTEVAPPAPLHSTEKGNSQEVAFLFYSALTAQEIDPEAHNRASVGGSVDSGTVFFDFF